MIVRQFYMTLLFLLLLLPRAAMSATATVTFTIVEYEDDGFALTSSSENYSADFAWAGYYSGYYVPYLIGAFRFNNVTIPQGATIDSAYLRAQAYTDGTGGSSLIIKGEDYDSADYLNVGEYLGLRTLTTAQTIWTVSSAWIQDSYYNSPSIKNIVQEIVNRPGWISGNAMCVHLRNNTFSGGAQPVMTKEGAEYYGGSPMQLIITYTSSVVDGLKSENYIPGSTNDVSSVPAYLNNSDMYYPDSPDGVCWATANGDIFGYWDRTAYGSVKYWNLIDHGTAPLLQSSLPATPGHSVGDVESVVTWLAHQYYGLERSDEKAILTEFVNQDNGLSFTINYLGPVTSTAEKTTFFGTVKNEIDAGRPISIGSWGTYFGGAHQVPVIGYKEMSNTVSSTVYVHRNMGGTQSEYVNFFSSLWEDLDMDQIIPGGTPVDHYEDLGDDSPGTSVSIEPDDVYNFRQTHNFDTAGDVDWIRLDTVSGNQYVVSTTNLGSECDTALSAYESDGTTLIVQDDDGGSESGASTISWRCWTTGTHFLKVYHKTGGSGPASNYDIQVSYSAINNIAPTNIYLSASAVDENRISGTVVGTLSAADPDYGNTFTYIFVAGEGSDDNGSFAISGSQLLTAAVFDYETGNSFSIRIRATDQGGLSCEKVFVISVQDIAESTSHGTLYTWLDQYGLVSGGDYEAADVGDPDGDGMLSWEEYVAGTVPTNSLSVFVSTVDSVNGQLLLHWSPDLTGAVPARVYSVYGASNLLSGFAISPVTNNVPAGTFLPVESFENLRFFKIGVEFSQ